MQNRYKENFSRITRAQQIRSDCNQIMFNNVSTTITVYINGMPVSPGTFYVSNGNYEDFNETVYDITFSGPVGDLWVIRKMLNSKA
jgi:hypothetical protein